MKNIIQICKENGVEIPEDKQNDLLKAISAEGYITTAEHEKKLGKIEADRDAWKEKAETAQKTLEGFDGIDPTKIKDEVETWKQKAADAQKDYEKKIHERDFEDALKSKVDGYKFTSEAAKKAVLAEIRGAGLTLRDGQILGLDDFVKQIKEKDASAFVDEQQEQLESKKARFTDKAHSSSGGTLTRKDIMAIKDRTERRRAIAENIELFENQSKGE